MVKRSLLALLLFVAALASVGFAHFSELDEAMAAEAEAYSAYDVAAELEVSMDAELDSYDSSFLEEQESAFVDVESEADAEAEEADDAPSLLEATATEAMLVEAEASTEMDTQSIPSELAKIPMTKLDTYNIFQDINTAVHKTVKYRSASGGTPNGGIVLRLHQTFAVQIPQQYVTASSSFRLVDQIGQAIPLTVISATKGRLLAANKHSFGRFFLEVINGRTIVYRAQHLFYFVFNPMHPDDATYVAPSDTTRYRRGNNVDLDEHLFNEFGAVFKGATSSGPSSQPWSFNQFDMTILDVCMGFYLRMTPTQRADVVRVTRLLSAIGSDVLFGLWKDDPKAYADGRVPWDWSDSIAIFQQFVTTNAPVRYGQCWVFSAITVSMARSLGIPASSVTTINSAHKYLQKPDITRDNVCNQRYVKSSSGEITFLDKQSDCSIWNFHVWAHVWIRRTDEADSTGWNAIDSTPQEASSGPNELPFTLKGRVKMNGPVALAPLRKMRFSAKWDGLFMSAATNGVLVRMLQQPGTNNFVVHDRNIEHIGVNTFSKLPDSMCNDNTPDQRGFTPICHTDLAREYSDVGTFLEAKSNITASFLEFGSMQEAAEYEGIDHEAAVMVPSLPGSFKVVPVRSDKKDTGAPRYGDTLRFTMALSSPPAGALKWNIEVKAVSERKDGGGQAKSVHKASGTTSDGSSPPPMELLWDKSHWMSPSVVEAFKWTTSFEIFGSVEQTSGSNVGASYEYHGTLFIEQPSMAIDCGKSKYNIGDTVECSVAVTDPSGVLVLKNAKVSIGVAGQTASSRTKAAVFPNPAVDRESNGGVVYNFGGLTVPVTTASSRWLGVVVRIISDGMPPMRATELILVQNPKAPKVKLAKKPGFFRGIFNAIAGLFSKWFKRRPVNDAKKAPQVFVL